MCDLSESNSNSKYDFIKKEEEIAVDDLFFEVKDETDSCLQNEARQYPEKFKYDEAIQLVEVPIDKYIRETAGSEQVKSEIFSSGDLLMNSKAPLRPSAQCVSSTFYNVVKREGIIDDELAIIKPSSDLQDMCMLNAGDEQSDSKYCGIVQQLQETNIICGVASCNRTLSEGKMKPGTCECLFLKNSNLEKSIMTGENLYKGEVVEHIRVQKYNLGLQITPNTGEKLFQCGLCQDNAVGKKTLINHIEIHNYNAPKKVHLMQHIRSHIGKKPFKCELCDYSALHKGNLVTHIRTHTGYKPFKCKLCDYSASQKTNLVYHIRTHTGVKPFKCKLCDYSASHQSSLVTHIRTHTGEKPFKCKFCDYSTSKNTNLVTHIRTHTGEKPFKCKMCDYSASKKTNLVTHMRTHTGEKPFRCEVCGYSASEKGTLVSHIRTHTGVKPFTCELCDYSASQKCTVVTHNHTHFREKSLKCRKTSISRTPKMRRTNTEDRKSKK